MGISLFNRDTVVFGGKMKTLKSIITALFVAVLLPVLAAAAPNLINYQGRLVDTNGNPLSGTYNITFTVYDAATAGTSLWTETQSVTLENGIFGVKLGASTPLTSNVYSADTRYLGVAVGSDPEMTPRAQLVSVPFALSAANITA